LANAHRSARLIVIEFQIIVTHGLILVERSTNLNY
jgi:hypothetical protein